MKYWLIGIGVVVLVTVLSFVGCAVSYPNQEAEIRNLIASKQKDNESEFDNMWKKISQVAQVDEVARGTLKDIFVSHAQARTTGGAQDGSLMKWVTESVPSIDLSTTKQLINIITGSRDAWTQRQKELLDFSRQHNNLLMKTPSKQFIAWFGNPTPIEVQIITSTKSAEAMRTGKDDDVDVFGKGK